MKVALEISDYWGWFVAIGLSLILAENSFKNGRDGYRFGFYLCGGNLFILFAMYFSEGGVIGGGWLEAMIILFTSIFAYFSYLGASTTFRTPKNVKCFRCQYVGYPSETDEVRTRHDEKLWSEFRNLDARSKRFSSDARK
jgi:hypothetical protein